MTLAWLLYVALSLILGLQTDEVPCQHILLVLVEIPVELGIAAPSCIKSTLHFKHLLLEFLQECQVASALLAEAIDVQIDGLQ